MSRFPTAGHAASWAGLAPGKHESAGKNRSSKTLAGNKHLKATLIQAAHVVGRSSGNYLAAQYRRLAALQIVALLGAEVQKFYVFQYRPAECRLYPHI